MAKTLMDIIRANEEAIFTEVVKRVKAQSEHYAAVPDEQLRASFAAFLAGLTELWESGRDDGLRAYAQRVSQQRVPAGFRISEIQRGFGTLKEIVRPYLEREYAGDLPAFFSAFRQLDEGFSTFIYTFSDAYAKTQAEEIAKLQEDVIAQQRRAIAELSTPVLQVWEGVLVLPIIGAVDSDRVRQIMEALLTRIVETQSEIVILDITGVPMVDTAVANHLIKTVQAARMLGARSIVTGLSPRVAQTVVELGVDLGDITTCANLRAGLEMALSVKRE